MSAHQFLQSVAFIVAAMGAVALLELAVPLFVPSGMPLGRRRANLAMTALALSFTFVLSSAVAMAALVLPLASPGLMALAGLPAAAQFVVGIAALDFAYGYAAHRSMHASPALWKIHRMHHSDEFVDVTTGFRTHPIEIVWRNLWLFVTVWALGVPAAAVVAFRTLSAVNGVFEHANIRVWPALDAAVSRVWVTPNMHKIHHSRERSETDTNYGNLLTLHDRVFGTFTPTERALTVKYGLEDVDPNEAQSFGRLLAMPWKSGNGQGREMTAAGSIEIRA